MTVHGAEIRDSHILKIHSGNHQLFETALHILNSVNHILALGNGFQFVLYILFQIQICLCGTDLV